MKKMISIIVPTLNEEASLIRLLWSLKKQTYLGLEIILVDGGSKDNTVQIANRYNARTVVLNGRSEFPSRNFGASLAKGDILIFTSADAIFPDDLLEKVLKKFEEDSELIAVRGPGIPYDGPLIGKIEYTAYNIFRYVASIMPKPFKRFSGSTNFLAVRKEIFEKVGGFCDDINADGLLGRELVKMGKVRYGFDTYVFISARRMSHMGFLEFNFHYLYVLENYLWLLSSMKKFKQMKLQRKIKHREMHYGKTKESGDERK